MISSPSPPSKNTLKIEAQILYNGKRDCARKSVRQNLTNINWFPGHMAKTRRQIEEDLKLVDIVVELLDARIPVSSQNPDLKRILKNKIVIKVLNKSDLADDKETKKWKEYFAKQGIQAVIVNSNTGQGIDETIRKIEEMMKEKPTFAVWDLEEEYVRDPEKFLSKGRSTPFDGWDVKGRCVATVIDGNLIQEYKDERHQIHNNK